MSLVSPPRSEQPQEVSRWRYFVTQILLGALPVKRMMFEPLSAAPEGKSGAIALSDGTGGGFDGSSGAGLYRHNGSTWVFIG